MKKILLLILVSLSFFGCATKKEIKHISGITVHKYSVKSLIEEDNNQKCTIQVFGDNKKDKDITTNFPCSQVKYFQDQNEKDI